MSKRRTQHAPHAPARQPRSQPPPTNGSQNDAIGPHDAASALLPFVAVATGLLALVVYLLTLAPTVPTGDSGELIAAAWVLGVPHPPGYPTFAMLAHLFGLIPAGEPAWRMNLMSAVFNAIAVALVVVIIYRLSCWTRARQERPGPSWIPLVAGVVGAAALAASTAFWSYSLVAEVFALNNFFAALLLLVMLEWHHRPGRTRLLWLFALLSGLAFTNHQTIVLFAPAFLVLLVSGLRKRVLQSRASGGSAESPRMSLAGVRLRDWLIAAALLIVGLLPYGYLPLAASRDPLVNWGDPDTLGAFLSAVTRSDYGTFRLTTTDVRGSLVEQLTTFGAYLASAFGPVALALALTGTAWFALRRRIDGLALLLAFLFSGPVFVLWANPSFEDPLARGVLERFYILPSIPVAIAIGAGVNGILELVATRLRSHRALSHAVPAALALGAIATVAAIGWLRFPAVDQSQNRVAEHYGQDLLRSLKPDALLLMRSDENLTSVAYAQVVKGERPDVVALDVELLKLPSYVEQQRREHPDLDIPWARYDDGETASLIELARANLDARPVYAVGELKEDLSENFDVLRIGLAREFVPQGTAPDEYAVLRADPSVISSLRAPATSFPDTTWEAAIADRYGKAAFDTAFALQIPQPQSNWETIELLYRESIRLAPTITAAHKNLGLLLKHNGGDPVAIIDAWERYLEVEPDDPQADALRSEIERLKAGS